MTTNFLLLKLDKIEGAVFGPKLLGDRLNPIITLDGISLYSNFSVRILAVAFDQDLSHNLYSNCCLGAATPNKQTILEQPQIHDIEFLYSTDDGMFRFDAFILGFFLS